MKEIDIKVPNIGDFTDVEVIEVLVNEGQDILKNDPFYGKSVELRSFIIEHKIRIGLSILINIICLFFVNF